MSRPNSRGLEVCLRPEDERALDSIRTAYARSLGRTVPRSAVIRRALQVLGRRLQNLPAEGRARDLELLAVDRVTVPRGRAAAASAQ